MSQQMRPRRSNLAVPGSSPKMLDKARGLAADQVFMDLEDAVAGAGEIFRGRLGENDYARAGCKGGSAKGS